MEKIIELDAKQRGELEQRQIQQTQNEIRSMKKLCHAVSGEAIGSLSDTMTDVLNRLGTKIVGLYQTLNIKDSQIAQHKGQIAELQAKLKKYGEPAKKETPKK